MKISTIVGRIVSLTLQSGESVCPCCRKPIRDNRNQLQKLISRFTGDMSLNSSLCECWSAFSPYNYHVDWFDK
jgi:hypothetical protein